jgi:hypothetical protein
MKEVSPSSAALVPVHAFYSCDAFSLAQVTVVVVVVVIVVIIREHGESRSQTIKPLFHENSHLLHFRINPTLSPIIHFSR